MTKKEFQAKMIRVRKHFERKDAWVCWSLGYVFNKNDMAFKGDSKVIALYRDIINGKERVGTGMYGSPYGYNNKNQQHRRNSIELFEVVMLDEKLYKGL